MTNKRFIIPDVDMDSDVTLLDTVTGIEYTDNFEDIVDLLNELDKELTIHKSKYVALKEAHFTKMGGFSMQRDGRGRYSIFSKNVIPKSSSIIRVASPDTFWNKLVVEMILDIIGDEE